MNERTAQTLLSAECAVAIVVTGEDITRTSTGELAFKSMVAIETGREAAADLDSDSVVFSLSVTLRFGKRG